MVDELFRICNNMNSQFNLHLKIYMWHLSLSLSSRKMCDDLITSNTRRKVTLKNPQIKTVTFHSILKSRRWSRAAVFTVLCCVSVTGVFVLPRGGRKFTVLTVFQSVLPWHVPHHLMLRDRLTLWDFLLNMYEYETIFIQKQYSNWKTGDLSSLQ